MYLLTKIINILWLKTFYVFMIKKYILWLRRMYIFMIKKYILWLKGCTYLSSKINILLVKRFYIFMIKNKYFMTKRIVHTDWQNNQYFMTKNKLLNCFLKIKYITNNKIHVTLLILFYLFNSYNIIKPVCKKIKCKCSYQKQLTIFKNNCLIEYRKLYQLFRNNISNK